MKTRIKNTYTNPQVVSIIFDEDTTFHEVINQFVKGLVKSKFAPRWEIIWHLEQVKELLK